MSGLPKLRLLPVLIFMAVLTLSVRIGVVWNGVEEWRVGQSEAMAQANVPAKPAPSAASNPAAQQVAQASPPAGGADPAAVPPDGQTPADGQPQAAPDMPPSEVGGLDRENASAFTQSEIDLLQRLSERRQQLEDRSRSLDQREAMMRAAEGRIDRKIAEMKTLEDSIQSLLKKHDEQEKQRLDRLVNIYKVMKPKDAARIFDDMELPLIVDIFMLMSERSTAPILAQMTPDKARAVTQELAHKQALPEPGVPVKG
ncbi:MotE family protein [Rhodospirillum sp. A1_3_36]|uniref:MotE family protein n=1 Tax=Rhodospirillum sp. A1_3_36 TaxID=3391666 RepID=UPI0039A63334